MDFFEHQEQARRRTGLLVVYFVLAVISIIVAVYLAVVAVFVGTQGDAGDALWQPEVLGPVAGGTLLVIVVGSLYKMADLARGGEVVARSLGGRPVLANTTELRERVLLNVVEEMAIASGTPVPPVFLLDHESAINAFAAGTTPQNAVIGVTRGTIETLKRDELQGVIAHEFSHILNGDMRLNLRLMGLLNGILLIAMIGYVLMRSGSTYTIGFSRSSGERKGGNPLPLLGLLLYIIGYIGVFFGHLIKSAVSRQREYLADASAVQFTRLPDGIVGALKKIGGLVQGSRLTTPQAEEASHMYFGNGLAAPFLELLATHPPLAERIRRIDPSFDGKYPAVELVEYSAADVVDPQRFAAQRERPAAVHAQAAAGAQSFAFQPAAAVAHVGAPRIEHLDYAAALVASLPAELVDNVRDPLGAVATVYALLLDDRRAEIREKQLAYLATQADPRANQETLRIAPAVGLVKPEAKLPLVSMVLPALKRLSPAQLTAFRNDVVFLTRADNTINLFEYAVHRLVLKRLLPRLEEAPQARQKYTSLAQVLPACRALLSTLSYAGTRDDALAARSFAAGAEKLGATPVPLELLPRAECGLVAFDRALDTLAGTAPALKKSVLEACAACIGADAQVSVEEGELLRVISDAFACPMPPLVKLAGD
ncbi:MAG TPA: M48 family metallopeptidase [Pirellulales bacterium]|nr:M48 family metallopeptidase [Pirellulales bacterium]